MESWSELNLINYSIYVFVQYIFCSLKTLKVAVYPNLVSLNRLKYLHEQSYICTHTHTHTHTTLYIYKILVKYVFLLIINAVIHE